MSVSIYEYSTRVIIRLHIARVMIILFMVEGFLSATLHPQKTISM